MRKIYVGIVENDLMIGVETQLRKFNDWMKSEFDTEVEFSFIDTRLQLKHKDFGVLLSGGDAGTPIKTAWGLDGIKQQLRNTGLIPVGQHHLVAFLYNLPQNWDYSNPIGAWTYPNDLNGAAFVEIPVILQHQNNDEIFRILSHESIHGFIRLAWWRGIPVRDTMDLYDKEFDVYAPDGNRARNIKALLPYLDTIFQLPRSRFLSYLMQQLDILYKKVLEIINANSTMTKSRIQEWAEAIKIYEGWGNGTRSFRNNNPGNLKYFGQKGSIGKDSGGYAIFNTYQDGMNALMRQLTIAADGTSRAYSARAHDLNKEDSRYLTLPEFFGVYAPHRDMNDPTAYALFVANKLQVDPQIQIKELL